jgi:ribose transport system substrate-binding protein
VVDCAFSSEAQASALRRLANERLDAIISLPIGNEAVAEPHSEVAQLGKKLILVDNAPTGLLPGRDYECLVSADNFGLGTIGAQLLSPHIATGGTVGLLGYDVDFFATNQREIAFRKWVGSERPDLTVAIGKFRSLDLVEETTHQLCDCTPELGGLFVVWDEPAIRSLKALRARGFAIPVTTTDLGNQVALDLARGGLIKGIGAQKPYDQGMAAAAASLLAMIGRQPPPWIALPGLSVTARNVVASYQSVWHSAAPTELLRHWRDTSAKQDEP